MLDVYYILLSLLFFLAAWLMVRLCEKVEEIDMEYAIGGVIAALIGAYLVFALLKPERF